jgi:RND family efflux transporter MFP subunit
MTDLTHDLAALRIEREPERPGAGRWILWIGLLILLSGGGFAGWRWFTRERPIEVQVATVSMRAAGTQGAVLNASGYVTARRRATVSSKITGKVIEVNVEEGMMVKEGQVLARLDASGPRAALALAEAQAEAARRGLRENEVRLEQARLAERRVTQLLTDRIVSQSQVDQAKADADSIEAHIAALREQISVTERQIQVEQAELSNYVIRAPFGGVAVSKDAQPGEMVSPVSAGGGFTRTGICTIVDMNSLEIEVDVNESYITRVSDRQPVRAVLDAYPDWSIPAHVITTVPTADRQKATVLVRIGFDALDARLLPDMGVKVTFLKAAAAVASETAQAPTLWVSTAAIRREGSAAPFVFVAAGGRASRRSIQVGRTSGADTQVTSGIAAGDRVIVDAPATLADGTSIEEARP